MESPWAGGTQSSISSPSSDLYSAVCTQVWLHWDSRWRQRIRRSPGKALWEHRPAHHRLLRLGPLHQVHLWLRPAGGRLFPALWDLQDRSAWSWVGRSTGATWVWPRGAEYRVCLIVTCSQTKPGGLTCAVRVPVYPAWELMEGRVLKVSLETVWVEKPI